MKLFLPAFLSLFFSISIFPQSYVDLSGTVYSSPFNIPLDGVSVTVSEVENPSNILGSDTTANGGAWDIKIVVQSLNGSSGLPNDYSIGAYPNPYNPSANIIFRTPESGSYTVLLLAITGEELARWNGSLGAGEHRFSAGGSAAGVEIIAISGDNYNGAYKILNLGGAAVSHLELINSNSSGSGGMRKVTDTDSLLITYSDPSGSHEPFNRIVPFTSATFRDTLTQLSQQGNATVSGSLIKLPTNTNAQDVTVEVQSGGSVIAAFTSSAAGTFSGSFPIEYWANGSDTLFLPAEVTLAFSGSNYQSFTSGTLDVHSLMHYSGTIQQTQITKTASASGNVKDTYGVNLSGAAVEWYDQDDQLRLSATTGASGNYSGTFNYQGYIDDPDDEFGSISAIRGEFTKSGYYDTTQTAPFQQSLAIDARLRKMAATVTVTITGHLTKLPTNTNAQSVTVAVKNGGSTLNTFSTGTGGTFSGGFQVNALINGSDTTYTPAQVTLAFSGSNYQSATAGPIDVHSLMHYGGTIQQTQITKTASASGNVKDNGGSNLSSVNVKWYDQSNNHLFSRLTNSSGNYSATFQYQGYIDDPNDQHGSITSIRAEFNKEGYHDTTRTAPFQQTLAISATMRQQVETYQFVFQVYDIIGRTVTDTDLKITWHTGDEITYTNSGGTVSVTETLPAAGADDSISIEHFNSFYTKWIIIYDTVQYKFGIEPIAQNEKLPSTPVTPFTRLSVEEAQNEGTLQLYLIMQQVERQPGEYIDVHTEPFYDMFTEQRIPWNYTTKWVPYQGLALRQIQFTNNLSNGNPATQQQIDQSIETQDKVTAAYTLANGVQLINLSDWIYLTDLNDPNWGQYSDGENVSTSVFMNTSPGNAVIHRTDNTIKYVESTYGQTAPYNTMVAENYAKLTNTTVSSADCYLEIAGHLTELGYTMAAMKQLLKSGTYWREN